MTIAMLRHWKSTFNEMWLIQWHSQESILTEEWKTEIINLVPLIKNKIFDCIYISDLRRSIESWEILSEHIITKQILITPSLREQWQWLFEWKPYYDADFQKLKRHESKDDEIYNELIGKYWSEHINNFKRRINDFFKAIDYDKNVLCITHWWVISLKVKGTKIDNGNIYTINNILWH